MITSEIGSGAVGYFDRGHRPERVPDIAKANLDHILWGCLHHPALQPLDIRSKDNCEVPIIPDAVVYFGSGAAVVVVFLGLCVMAYMLIFTESRSHDMDELYGFM
ncbi:hypothetical protein V5799_030465 [Amblyomma americanum]|uniref:Uncharacterized protein n=1 Tax=Amblyomma americanum TaxID=6943 RepID=A0AAQ4ENA9_AMBAM